MYAYISLPETSKSGVVKVNTPITAKGIAKKKTNGLNFPHRVLTRSEIAPIIGSFTASKIRVSRNIVPTAAAGIPNTSV